MIPETVEEIEISAFISSSLTSLSVPGSVKKIGDSAFSGSTSLRTVTLNDGVESIGFLAFSNCFNLEYMRIPDSVTSIGPIAFDQDYKLYISANAGSYAEQYAETQRIRHGQPIQEDPSVIVAMSDDLFVPQALKDDARYADVTAVKEALNQNAEAEFTAVYGESKPAVQTAYYELTPFEKKDNLIVSAEGKTFESGLPFTIPYPEGTNAAGYRFVVSHLKSTGDVETVPHTEEPDSGQPVLYREGRQHGHHPARDCDQLALCRQAYRPDQIPDRDRVRELHCRQQILRNFFRNGIRPEDRR